MFFNVAEILPFFQADTPHRAAFLVAEILMSSYARTERTVKRHIPDEDVVLLDPQLFQKQGPG